MAAPVGLTDIPVADNHCHAVEAEQPDGVAQWRQYFSESPDPQMRTGCAPSSPSPVLRIRARWQRRAIRAGGAEHPDDRPAPGRGTKPASATAERTTRSPSNMATVSSA